MRTLIRLLVALAASLPGRAQSDWWRLASPHFELLTDAGPRGAVQVLDRLETVRHVFLESIGGKAPPVPVRVFLFARERDFRRYEPRRAVGGFHQGGPERDYIVLFGTGPEAQRAARHEFIHVLLSHTSAPLPLWLEEGTAELYSTVELNTAGALVGLPVPEHVQALGRLDWLSARALAAVERKAPLLDDPARAGLFYAQSWALTHMLNLAPEWRRGMARFAQSLDQGTPAELAFEPAFGFSFEHALREARVYLRQGRLPAAAVAVAPRAALATKPEPLPAAAAGLAQAELLTALGRAAESDRLLAALDQPGAPPEVDTALGLAALGARRDDEALRRFRAAISKRARSAVPYFETAMLLRDRQAPASEVRRYLAEAVGRNPHLAEAHFILATLEQREGRHREAIASLEEATRVLPRQSYFWHARALSHRELGQPELARRAALRAVASAADPAQRQMAESALKLVAQPAGPSPPPPAKPEVAVPESWQRSRGDATIEGTLEHIDCHGTSARLQVRAAGLGPPVSLWVDKPGEVLLNDASSITFTFACGVQKPRKVTVEYQTAPKLPRGTLGWITAIRFHN